VPRDHAVGCSHCMHARGAEVVANTLYHCFWPGVLQPSCSHEPSLDSQFLLVTPLSTLVPISVGKELLFVTPLSTMVLILAVKEAWLVIPLSPLVPIPGGKEVLLLAPLVPLVLIKAEREAQKASEM